MFVGAKKTCNFQQMDFCALDGDYIRNDLAINYQHWIGGIYVQKHIFFKDLNVDGSNNVIYTNVPTELDGAFTFVPAPEHAEINNPLNTKQSWELGAAAWANDCVCYVGLYKDKLLVANKFVNPYIADYNGQPNQIIETNSDNSTRITEPIPAYWKADLESGSAYRQMRDAHKLTQTCMIKVSGKTATGSTAYVLRASATVWGQANQLPYETYVWKQDMILPWMPVGGSMPDFNFVAGGSNDASWQCTNRITRYNNYSQVLESVKVPTSTLPLTAATVYGYGSLFPIATIANAKADECGIYTGDYDDGKVSGYWDYDNGWQKGNIFTSGVIELSAMPHYGLKSLHVRNGYSAVKAIKIDRTKDYTFSAWVKANTGTKIRFGVELHADDGEGGMGAWIGAYDFIDQGFSTSDWHYVENTVKASDLDQKMASGHSANEIAYYLIWIGRNSEDTFVPDFYADDIRFYPANALVSSTFYTSPLMLPIKTSDANCFGHKVDYDGFGRVTAEYNAKGQLVKSYKYHLMSELYTNQFSAGDQNFIPYAGSPLPEVTMVSGGFGPGGSCSRVDFKGTGNTRLVKLDLPAANFKGKKGTLQGYYKSTSGNKVEIALWWDANQTTKQFVADGTWQTFSIDFDFTGLTPSTVKIYADMFTGSDYIAYFDEINAFGW
jgi:YD repeat-containing protein